MGEAFAFFCWARHEFPYLTSAGHYQPTFNNCALDAWRSDHSATGE